MPLDGTDLEIIRQNEVLEVLREARECLARSDGWCQGAMMGSNGSIFQYCAWGAVSIFIRDEEQVLMGAARALKDQIPSDFRVGWPPDLQLPIKHLIAYNDAPNRTQAEIITLFDGAIAELEKHRT